MTSTTSPAVPTVPCTLCGVAYTPEHPAQRICRVCTSPRCPICRTYLADVQSNAVRDRVYCSLRCRQRARAGLRYTLLGRDNYTCQKCKQKYDENKPQELKRLMLKVMDGTAPSVASNVASFCEACEPDNLPAGTEAALLRRTLFFQIDPNQPLGPVSRQEMRRRHRK